MRSTERHFHQFQHSPVYFRYLHLQMSSYIVRFQLGIQTGIELHGRIPSQESSTQQMVTQSGLQVVSSQPISSIVQLIHLSVKVEMRVGREKIQSFSIGMQVHGYSKNGILRQELMKIEVVYNQIGQISLIFQVVLGINTGCSTHPEPLVKRERIVVYGDSGRIQQAYRLRLGLSQEQVHHHFAAFHGKTSIQRSTLMNGYTSVCQRVQEIHVVGFCLESKLPTSLVGLGKVQQVSLHVPLKSSRQFGRKGGKAQTVQISIGFGENTQRLGRIGFLELRIHAAHYFHHIPLANLTLQTGRKSTIFLHFENIPTYFGLQINGRIGGTSYQLRYTNDFIIGTDAPLGAHQFQSGTF